MKKLIKTLAISLLLSPVCSCMPQPEQQMTPQQNRWTELEIVSAESNVSDITDTSVKISVSAEFSTQKVDVVEKSCSIEYYEAGKSEEGIESVHTREGFIQAEYYHIIWKSEATISNLKPDTEYNYIVVFNWKDTKRGLGKGSFKTAPAQNPAE